MAPGRGGVTARREGEREQGSEQLVQTQPDVTHIVSAALDTLKCLAYTPVSTYIYSPKLTLHV